MNTQMPQPSVFWQKLNAAPTGVFLLLACPSRFVGPEWLYCIGRFTFKSRWEDASGDDLTEKGFIPKYWSALPNPPESPDEIKSNLRGYPPGLGRDEVATVREERLRKPEGYDPNHAD